MVRWDLSIWVGLLLFLFLASPVCAESVHGYKLSLQGGWRQENLDWDIAGVFNGSEVDILSELNWKELQIAELVASARLDVTAHSYPELLGVMQGRLAYGLIFDGVVIDSDYAGSGRTFIFSRSRSDAGDGDVMDGELSLGVTPLQPWHGVEILPQIGLEFHIQRLTMFNGVQVLSRQFFAPGVALPPLGPFAGLDSRYDTYWFGGWLGVEIASRDETQSVFWGGSLRLSRLHLYAEADWNLREDFAHPVSFTHEGDGYGGQLGVWGGYRLGDHLLLTLQGEWLRAEVKNGIDLVYLSVGSVARTRLNHVERRAQRLLLGLSYCY
ncbi:MAG: hypothetical protein C0621_04030 [Desulfuromonas sp.]|nr:MAG: hypothetical protein C0621_04030 [Desulfuromonas sp.]